MAVPSRPDIDVSGTILEPPPGLNPDCLLFLGDPEKKTYTKTFRIWPAVAMGIAFGIGSLVANKMKKVPLHAAIHRHVLHILFGAGVGEGLYHYQMRYYSERDLQYYHYMVLHPEDFQAPERKKWADVLQPWTPMR